MKFALRILCWTLPLALFLPFDPQWPDFERARRGILLLVVGAFALLGGVGRERREATFAPLTLFAIVCGASIFWAHDRGAAVEASAFAVALAMLPWLVPEAGGGAAARFRPGIAHGFALALAAVALYGILQGMGLAWPRDYTVPHEPVSTFGNRNVAAEACAAATPLALAGRPAFGWPAVLCAAAYLGLNGGRAGMLAFALGLLTLFVLRTREKRIQKPQKTLVTAALALALVGTGGYLLRTAAPTPSDAAVAVEAASETDRVASRAGDTLEVRRLLYASTIDLATDALPFGVGAGNFRVQFPRFRSAEEIEISSQGHRFGTRVVVAHNDPLQIFAELGVFGLALFLAALFCVVQAVRRERLASIGIASIVAFVPLTLLRAPTFNAAAVAALLVSVAACLRPSGRAKKLTAITRTAFRVLGLSLIVAGASIVYGELQGAEFLRAKLKNDPVRGAQSLERAIRIDPLESDWVLLRAQLHHKLGSRVPDAHLGNTLRDLQTVLDRRPYEYKALIDLGYLGLVHAHVQVGNRTLAEAGAEATAALLSLDPGHPQGLFLASEYAFAQGKVQAGLDAMRKLRNSAVIRTKQAQIAEMQRKEPSNEQKLQLARIRLALGKLHDELFPKK